MWENVPDSVRSGFQTLLAMVNEGASERRAHDSRLNELEQAMVAKLEAVESALARHARHLAALEGGVALLQR